MEWFQVDVAAERGDFFITPLEPQSRFGDKLLEIWQVCPQNGTAVLKGLKE